MQITLDTNNLSTLDVDVIKLLAERTSAPSLAPKDEDPRAEEPKAEAPEPAEAPKPDKPEEPKKAPVKRTRRAPAKKAEEPKAEEPKADLQAAIALAKEFMGKLGKPEAVKLALATVDARRVSELKGDAIGAFVEELNNAR